MSAQGLGVESSGSADVEDGGPVTVTVTVTGAEVTGTVVDNGVVDSATGVTGPEPQPASSAAARIGSDTFHVFMS